MSASCKFTTRGALALTLLSLFTATGVVRSQVTAEEFPMIVKEGYVFSRALVLGPHGQPIFAEFNDKGDVIDVIGEATDEGSPKLGGASVITGATYVAQVQPLVVLQTQDFDRNYEILTAAEFNQRSYPPALVADPQPGDPDHLAHVPVVKPLLYGNTRSVVALRPESMRSANDARNPVVLQGAIDFSAVRTDITAATSSVLIDSSGKVVRAGQPPVASIGYRAAYWYDRSSVITPNTDGFNHQVASAVYAEVDKGKTVGVIKLDPQQMAGSRVISVDAYKDYQSAYRAVQDQVKGVQVYSAQEYASHDFGQVTLPDPQPGKPDQTVSVTIIKAAVGEGMNSVVVRKADAIKNSSDATSGFVLLQTPLAANGLTGGTPGGKALILSAQGSVLKTSGNDIVFQPAFSNPGTPVLTNVNNGISHDTSLGDDANQLPWGPVAGAKVYSTLPQPNGVDATAPTDETGHYVLTYLLPQCPGFFFEYEPYLMAEVRFRDFNPRRRGGMVAYTSARQMYDVCNGEANGPPSTDLSGQMAQLAAKEVALSAPSPPHRFDMPVDIVALSGRGRVRNPDGTGVAIGDSAYDYPTPDQSTASTPAGRIADALPDFANRGLLKRISADDLRQHTDLFLYRVSNGQLLSQRQGLPAQPAYNDGGVAQNESDAKKICDDPSSACFYFMMSARGIYKFDLLGGDLLAFQQATQVPASLQGQHADHLRPGETVKIIAINRATGYIGSTTLSAQSLGQLQNFAGQLDQLPEIVMGPPNLKIWAERDYTVAAGFTKGASHSNMVGTGGASLINDEKVRIYTQWLDQDGSSLPPDLPGYTGRFARAVSASLLVDAGSDAVAHFEIKPGLQTQVMLLPEDASAAAHYYVHVSGYSKDSSPGPDFSPGATDAENLIFRPKHYVPFMVPVSDQASTLALVNTSVGLQRRVTAAFDLGMLVGKANQTAEEVKTLIQSGSFDDAAAVVIAAQVQALADAVTPLKDQGKTLAETAARVINNRQTGNQAEALGSVFELSAALRALKAQAEVLRDNIQPTPSAQAVLHLGQVLAGQVLSTLDFADIVEAGGSADAALILQHADWRDVQGQYGWYYRPEYQISRLKLELQTLDVTTDFYTPPLGADGPQPPRNQSQIDLTYTLYGGTSDPLPGFDLPTQLILALGYLETLANVDTQDGQTQTLHNTDLEDALAGALGGNQRDTLQLLTGLSAADFSVLQLYTNNDPANGLMEYVGVPPIVTQTRRIEITRTAIASSFDASTGATQTSQETDGYTVIPFSLLMQSKVTLRLLDDRKAEKRKLIDGVTLAPGTHSFALAYVDVVGEKETPTGIKPIRGTDYYIEMQAESLNPVAGGFQSYTYKVRFPGELTPDHDGRMLGQNVVHDVLIQDGSLTLSRGDFGFPGLGPSLALVRSYTDHDNSLGGTLGQGWRHSLDISLQVKGYGKVDTAAAEFNLPQWIADGRKKFDPKEPESPSAFNLMSVSNGGVFKKIKKNGAEVWYPQRGNHGKLIETSSDFTYVAKDGTRYNFPRPDTPRNDDACPAATTLTGAGVAGSMPAVVADFIALRVGVSPALFLLKKPVSTPLPASPAGWIEDRHKNRMTLTYQRVLDDALNESNHKICKGAAAVYQDLLSEAKDAVGRKLTFKYAPFGKAQRIYRIDGPDGSNTKMEYGYDVHTLPPEAGSGDTEPREVALLTSAKRNGLANEQYAYAQEQKHDAYNLITNTDPIGHVTTYTYALPEQIDETIALGLNSEDVVVQLQYPDDAKITYAYPDKFHRNVVDAMSHPTNYTLNDVGNPLTIAETGRTTTLGWSEIDDVMLTKSITGSGPAHKWTYTYDLNGNLLTETDPLNFVTTSTWTDKYSLLASRQDRNGINHTYTYDDEGNLTGETDGNGKPILHGTYNHGLRGNTIDARGFKTSFGYDQWGVLNKIDRPLSVSTAYGTDIRGRRTSMTDPNGNVWKYGYDDLDHLTSERDPDGHAITYAYDNKGNKLTEVSRLGLSLTYVYDKRDRVQTTTRSGPGEVGGKQTFDYNLDGDLRSETDWLGQATRHDYDELNHRIGTTDRAGQSWAYVVDAYGNLTQESAPNHRVTTNVYDADDRLESKDEAGIRTTRYAYDPEGHTKHVTDAEGRETLTDYDGEYRVHVVTERGPSADGGIATRVTTYDLDENGNRHGVTDPNNNLTTTDFDALNRPYAVHAPEGRELAYVYDPNGNLKQEDKPNGSRTYDYDAENRRIDATMADGGFWQTSYDAGGNTLSTTDPNGYTTTMRYDSAGRLRYRQAADGGVSHTEYDDNGNKRTSTDARGAATSWVYDKLDRVKLQRAPENRNTAYDYDEVGNRKLLIDPRGIHTLSHYDLLSRLESQDEGLGGADATPRSRSFVYDKTDHLTSTTDGRGITTTTAYDAFYRVAQVEQAVGTTEARTTSKTYDAVGNLLTSTDGNHHTTQYAYDGLNRLTDTQNPDGTHVVRQYDSENLLSLTDEAAQTSTYDYDGEDRQKLITNPNGETTATYHDGAGNLIEKDLPRGNRWYYHYDPVNRLAGIDTPAGSTQYGYDKNGNLQTTQDADGQATSYGYDQANRRNTLTQPKTANGNAVVTQYSYDEDDNKLHVTDPNGQVHDYGYDSLNRLIRASAPASSGSYPVGGSVITYTHDEDDNLLTVQEQKPGGTDTSSYVYDHLNRATTDNQRGHAVTRSYDPEGNIKTVASGSSHTYKAYDSRNRLTAVSGSPLPADGSASGAAVQYTYTPDGKIDTQTDANGVTTSHSYDPADRLTRISHQGSGGLVDQFDYSYDPNGNRTSEDETTPSTSQHTDYGYDNADRLTYTVVSPAPNGQGQGQKEVDYTLDNNGNRLYEQTTEDLWIHRNNGTDELITRHTSQSTAYDGNNRIVTVTQRDDDHKLTTDQQAFAYDANGNLITITHTSAQTPDTRNYAYDSRDQLVYAAHTPPATEQIPNPTPITLGTYDYDYRGLRIRHSGARGTIETIWDGNQVIEEFGSQNASYVRGHGLVTIQSQQGTQYVQQDSLGSTRTLTDEGGATAASYTLDAFGNIQSSSGSSPSTQIFTGHEHDQETGLIYMKGRYYIPDLGVFLTQDSLTGRPDDPWSFDRYLYANANPTVYIDADGHTSIYFDGTWNDKDDAPTIASDSTTNVAKLFEYTNKDEQRRYINGVATRTDSPNWEGALGKGVEERVNRGYAELMKIYNDPSSTDIDRKINIFGFSRGSTEARLLVTKLQREGIPHKVGADENGNPVYGEPFRPKINFLGVFDTVASSTEVNEKDLAVDPDFVNHGVHLIAADEKRNEFPVESMLDPTKPAPPNLEEYYVFGVHSDDGGGYARGDQGKSNAMAIAYLKFMMNRAEQYGVPVYKSLSQDDMDKLNQVRGITGGNGGEMQFTHESRQGWVFGFERYVYRDNRGVYFPSTGKHTKVRSREMHERATRDGIIPRTFAEMDSAPAPYVSVPPSLRLDEGPLRGGGP